MFFENLECGFLKSHLVGGSQNARCMLYTIVVVVVVVSVEAKVDLRRTRPQMGP